MGEKRYTADIRYLKDLEGKAFEVEMLSDQKVNITSPTISTGVLRKVKDPNEKRITYDPNMTMVGVKLNPTVRTEPEMLKIGESLAGYLADRGIPVRDYSFYDIKGEDFCVYATLPKQHAARAIELIDGIKRGADVALR